MAGVAPRAALPDEPRAAEARPEQFVDLRLVQGLQRAGYFDRLGVER
jgi:hypothetical protein